MKYILSIIICLALFSCHDVKVGYLETEAAQYNPNVLEVTKSQDANDPLHVVSPPIEGVEGTQPIYITIRQVTTTDGDKVAFLKEVTAMATYSGRFILPSILKEFTPIFFNSSVWFTRHKSLSESAE